MVNMQTHASGQMDGLPVIGTAIDFDTMVPSIKVARMSNILLCSCTTVIHVLDSTVDAEAE
jgi:hypothetical protein